MFQQQMNYKFYSRSARTPPHSHHPHVRAVDVAAFINKNDELQAENVALVAHSNAVTLNVAELTSYSNAVVPIVNELQAQNAELTSYSNAVVPLVNELQAQNAELTSYSNAIAPLINQVQARSGCQGGGLSSIHVHTTQTAEPLSRSSLWCSAACYGEVRSTMDNNKQDVTYEFLTKHPGARGHVVRKTTNSP